MKSKNISNLFIVIFLASFLAPTFMVGTLADSPYSYDTEMVPDAFLYTDATVTVSDTAIRYSANMINALQNSDQTWEEAKLSGLPLYSNGIVYSYIGEGLWNIEVKGLTIDAPFDISNAVVDSTVDDSNDVDVYPPHEESEQDIDFGLASLYGSATYLYKNSTDDCSLTYHEWSTTAFSSNTYQYGMWENGRSISTTANSSIVVTFYEDTTTSINFTETTTYDNVTVYNDLDLGNQLLWFRFDLERTNSSRPYVRYITVTNLKVDGFFFFSLAADNKVTDNRYTSFYLGDDTTTLGALLNPAVAGEPKTISGMITGDMTDPDVFESFWTSLNARKILQTTRNLRSYTPRASQICTFAKGWATGAELESDFKKSVAAWEGTIQPADIVTYTVSKLFWGQSIKTKLATMMKETLYQKTQVSSSIRSVVTDTLNEIMPQNIVACDVAPSFIKTLEYGVMRATDTAPQTSADDVDEISAALLAASKDQLGKATTVLANALNKLSSNEKFDAAITGFATFMADKLGITMTYKTAIITLVLLCVAMLGAIIVAIIFINKHLKGKGKRK